jgi:hypothetical protein
MSIITSIQPRFKNFLKGGVLTGKPDRSKLEKQGTYGDSLSTRPREERE